MQTLLERVKTATGPDREIDAEVMFDLFAKPVGARDDGGPTGYLWPEDNPSWSFGVRFPGKDREWFTAARQKVEGETLTIWRDDAWVLMNSLRIPQITASLDAVLELVERVLPGWAWSVGNLRNGAQCYLMHRPGAALLGPGLAATPPLAVLSALLTALITQQQEAA